MAKIIQLPSSIKELSCKSEAAYLEAAEEYCRERYSHPLSGKMLRFQVADSFAQYMVAGHEELVHLTHGDGWSIADAHIRGLNQQEISNAVEQLAFINSLFEESEPHNACL